eukprot:3608928-Prymnesium_polylepis.3
MRRRVTLRRVAGSRTELPEEGIAAIWQRRGRPVERVAQRGRKRLLEPWLVNTRRLADPVDACSGGRRVLARHRQRLLLLRQWLRRSSSGCCCCDSGCAAIAIA